MKFYKKDHSILALPEEQSKPAGYHEITEEQYHNFENILGQIAEKIFELKKTDFKALKFAEGWISEEEYAPIKSARQSLRDQINELEAQL